MSSPEVIRHAKIRRIKAGSLFKLIFVISLSVFIPFFLLCGIAALFGAKTVSVGDSHVTGVMGLVSAIIMMPIFAACFGGCAWFFSYLAIRVVGRFSPLGLDYVSAEEESIQSPQPTPGS